MYLLQTVNGVNAEIYITGANLHVVNSAGSTDGTPNAVGNIIIAGPTL